MKKILMLLSAFGLMASSSTAVVTCRVDNGWRNSDPIWNGRTIHLNDEIFKDINIKISEDSGFTDDVIDRSQSEIKKNVDEKMMELVGQKLPNLDKYYQINFEYLKDEIKELEGNYRRRKIEVRQIYNWYIFQGTATIYVNYQMDINQAFKDISIYEGKVIEDSKTEMIRKLNDLNELHNGQKVKVSDVNINFKDWTVLISGNETFYGKIVFNFKRSISEIKNNLERNYTAFKLQDDQESLSKDEFKSFENQITDDIQSVIERSFPSGPTTNDWKLDLSEIGNIIENGNKLEKDKPYKIKIKPNEVSHFFANDDGLELNVIF